MRVLLTRFHLNGNTKGFHPQSQKLVRITFVNNSTTDSGSERTNNKTKQCDFLLVMISEDKSQADIVHRRQVRVVKHLKKIVLRTTDDWLKEGNLLSKLARYYLIV